MHTIVRILNSRGRSANEEVGAGACIISTLKIKRNNILLILILIVMVYSIDK